MNRTPLLLETIRIEKGRPCHLEWHNRRFNRARRELFGSEEELDLGEFLTRVPVQGTCRCRILYRAEVEKVEFLSYMFRLPRSFVLTEFTGKYDHKYADRSLFERLKIRCPEAEELILCRNGLITDTTIANIALRKGSLWYTPKKPLLAGTTRARLLSEGSLIEADLPHTALREFDELALMNAMIGFRPIEAPDYIIM